MPIDYRRVLGVVGEAPMHLDNLRTRLARYSETELEHLLDELAELGLLEASGKRDTTTSTSPAISP